MPSYGAARAAFQPSEAWLYDRDGRLIDSTRVNFDQRRLAWVPLPGIAPAVPRALIAADKEAPVYISPQYASSPGFYYPAVSGDDIVGRYPTVGVRAKF